MKSENGMVLHKFVLLIICLMIIGGIAFYVIIQENGVVDTQIKKMTTNSIVETNTINN